MQEQTQVSWKHSQSLLKIFALAIVLPSLFDSPAFADAISPNITSGGKVYSEERPHKEFFGNGMSGRLSEASYLRFMGEQALDDGDLPNALKKLSKAVQLDPGDPTGHMMYARAMTTKINRTLRKGEPIDEELLANCIEEWKLIWRHDADTSEQAEAKAQARRLVRIAKQLLLAKQGKMPEQNMLADKGSQQSGNSKTKFAGKNSRRLALKLPFQTKEQARDDRELQKQFAHIRERETQSKSDLDEIRGSLSHESDRLKLDGDNAKSDGMKFDDMKIND